ncbi:MAG: pilus assembly protein PilM [Candidatus Omnitrophota bacterium]|nr:pilus assembly protein PilM [Candidatus Omnitrophota bacterium]
MFSFPFKKLKFGKMGFKKPAVIVEIGNDWLKIAESSPSPLGAEITRISLHKLALIKENLSAAISDIFKDLSINRQHVILCMPRHLLTVRVLDLPSIDPKEIDDMINLQVGKQTPYSRDEITSTHKIMYSAREGYTKVMLAIVQRSIVSERLETLKNAGVTVGKVVISSEGVYNWFSLAYLQDIKVKDSETVAVLDIDSNYSDFITIYKGKLVFTKNIFIGANHLLEKSEEWKVKLVEELGRCLKRYYIEEKNAKIERLFLAGAASGIESLDVSLSGGLEMIVEKTETFRNVRIKKDLKSRQEENMKLVSLTPIIGASAERARLELDLTSGEHKIFKLMEKKRLDLTIMGILSASILMTLSLLLVIGLYYKNTYLTQLKSQAVVILADSDNVEKMRMSIDMVKRLLDAKKSSLTILHEIYTVTPPEISLTSIDIEESKQVVLKGRSFAMSDVFKFIKKIEESAMFANVKASYTRTKREKVDEKETEYAEFEIVCPYESK